MILYLDSSAIVKRYVAEHASGDVVSLMAASEANATSLVSRAEVAAALARAVRLGVVDGAGGQERWPGTKPCAGMTPFNWPRPSRGRKQSAWM